MTAFISLSFAPLPTRMRQPLRHGNRVISSTFFYRESSALSISIHPGIIFTSLHSSVCSYYSATFGRGRPVRYDYHPLYVPSNINLWQPMYLPYASKSISGRAFAAALALFPRRSNNATSTTSAPLPSLELPSIEEIKPSGSPSIHVSSKGMPKALHASQAVHTATACTTPVKPLFIRKLGESWKNHCIRALKDSLIKQFFFSEELHEDVYAGIDILKSSTDREHINSQIQYIQDELEAFARNVNPFDLATEELKSFNIDLLDAVGSTYPEISNVSQYLLTIPGKRFRPLLAYLMNKTLATHFSSEQILQDGTYQHKMIEVAEMIHTASIMHDDVLDVADVRRGVPTANKIFDNKKAILGGDFLLARACRISASFGIPEVCERTANIVESLAKGELIQSYGSYGNIDEAFKIYLTKTYYKTAALMGETCACGALLGGFPEHLKEFSFKLGGVIGMAFQLYDDVLDFTSSSDALGKPVLNDIRSGVITSPVLLSALEHSHTLTPLIARKFSKEGDFEIALQCIQDGVALQRALLLVMLYAQRALKMLQSISEQYGDETFYCVYSRGLVALLLGILIRNKG